MAKYKLIVADTTNPAYSRMTAQVAFRIAVSFGYPLRQNFIPLEDEVLIFDPNDKSIIVKLRHTIDTNSVTMAYTADYLISALENPEVLFHTVKSVCGKVQAVIYHNGVGFSTTEKMSEYVFVPKDFLLKVAKSDDRKGLPLMAFEYNDKLRLVRITRFDERYLQGFEIASRGSEIENGTFKKFHTDRIINLELMEFIQS